MKLAVSNIAWDPPEEDAVLDLLARQGVAGVEVAPTKWWPDWVGAESAAAERARRRLAARGFAVPALQAILFARPELQVFGPPEVQERTLDHLARVARLAADLGARVLVFGSPKNRTPGELGAAEANQRACAFFRRAGEACRPAGVELCIEPNPEVYQCDFMTHWHEVLEMVERVGHPSVGIHLDAACIALAGDDPAEAVRTCGSRIRHFHATEPQLGDFAEPQLDHAAFGAALAEVGYPHWVSIEMRRPADPLRSIEEAVRRVLGWYA